MKANFRQYTDFNFTWIAAQTNANGAFIPPYLSRHNSHSFQSFNHYFTIYYIMRKSKTTNVYHKDTKSQSISSIKLKTKKTPNVLNTIHSKKKKKKEIV